MALASSYIRVPNVPRTAKSASPSPARTRLRNTTTIMALVRPPRLDRLRWAGGRRGSMLWLHGAGVGQLAAGRSVRAVRRTLEPPAGPPVPVLVVGSQRKALAGRRLWNGSAQRRDRGAGRAGRRAGCGAIARIPAG